MKFTENEKLIFLLASKCVAFRSITQPGDKDCVNDDDECRPIVGIQSRRPAGVTRQGYGGPCNIVRHRVAGRKRRPELPRRRRTRYRPHRGANISTVRRWWRSYHGQAMERAEHRGELYIDGWASWYCMQWKYMKSVAMKRLSQLRFALDSTRGSYMRFTIYRAWLAIYNTIREWKKLNMFILCRMLESSSNRNRRLKWSDLRQISSNDGRQLHIRGNKWLAYVCVQDGKFYILRKVVRQATHTRPQYCN